MCERLMLIIRIVLRYLKLLVQSMKRGALIRLK